MFVLDRLFRINALTGNAGFETAPEIIAQREQVNPGTPPTALFEVLIAIEDVTPEATIITSREGIGIQEIFVGVLTF